MSTSSQASGTLPAGTIILTSREAWMWILVLLVLGAIVYVAGTTLWQLFVASIRGPSMGRAPPPMMQPPATGYGQGYGPPPQSYGQGAGPARMRATGGRPHEAYDGY